MTQEEFELYSFLLEDYYGKDFISDYETLKDLFELEFDIKISIKDLQKFNRISSEIEDIELTKNHCGINY